MDMMAMVSEHACDAGCKHADSGRDVDHEVQCGCGESPMVQTLLGAGTSQANLGPGVGGNLDITA